MKCIKKIIVIIVVLIIFTLTVNVNAESEFNINDINYYSYTDDELFDFEGNNYDFQKYIDSIIGWFLI